MADESARNHAPVPQDGGVPATSSPVSCRAELDAHGFDPNEFEWRPVPRRPRADGWTPDVQRRFIQALAETGTVEGACRIVGMSVGSAYRLRNAPGSEGFARAWRDVTVQVAERLLDVCFERAIQGWDEPVFDRDGIRIGAKQRFDHRLAINLLRAYIPERFGGAPSRAARPPAEPVARNIERLGPATPDAPHLLTEPDRMVDLIDGARGRAEAEALHPRDEREPYQAQPVEASHPAALARRHARLAREENRRWRAMTDDEREAASRPHRPAPYCGNPDDPWHEELKAKLGAERAAENGEEAWLDDAFDDEAEDDIASP